MNRSMKAPANRQGTIEFELPPDPMAKWEEARMAIVDPPSHIRDKSKAEPFRYEGKGFPGRLNTALLNWMRGNTD